MEMIFVEIIIEGLTLKLLRRYYFVTITLIYLFLNEKIKIYFKKESDFDIKVLQQGLLTYRKINQLKRNTSGCYTMCDII